MENGINFYRNIISEYKYDLDHLNDISNNNLDVHRVYTANFPKENIKYDLDIIWFTKDELITAYNEMISICCGSYKPIDEDKLDQLLSLELTNDYLCSIRTKSDDFCTPVHANVAAMILQDILENQYFPTKNTEMAITVMIAYLEKQLYHIYQPYSPLEKSHYAISKIITLIKDYLDNHTYNKHEFIVKIGTILINNIYNEKTYKTETPFHFIQR